MLRGLDASRWNGPGSVPWDEVDFGFVRLTYGLRVDPRAEEHLWRGRKAGKLLGGYHWLDCSAGVWGGEQAELFLATAARKMPAGLLSIAQAVDVEPSDPKRPDDPSRCRIALRDFVGTAARLQPCAVYLSLSEALRLGLSDFGLAASQPLWLADWSPPYPVPLPWDRWTVLQTGKKGGVDRDVFDGTAEDFRRAFGLCP